MSENAKVIRSQLHWVTPPDIGQPLEELEWVFIDVYDDGSAQIRPEPPSDREAAEFLAAVSSHQSSQLG
ncbi:hypothetical protein [Pseudomonas sp. OIL-1]|uniref:hypothetical protein n=1 Tax=Pseudomonas sp. OIL-1 TaxID=2706126 RepID=UPI0013A7547A|nr:hypothetical protein [Pseudomonas sp. OIL-1]QIB50088.1 hypothetical protein G3M63_02830 [Pseudomonas sp. OIL-1]